MRVLKYAAVLIVALALAGWLTTPPRISGVPAIAIPDHNLDAWLAERERATPWPLIAGTEKRIVWLTADARTDYVVVNFPGFSATRQETAPVAERIAAGLGANLVETRWAGHGRAAHAMVGVRAEDWLADAEEALQLAARLGERVVIVSSSTGGTLALAMAGHQSFASVDAVVLMSPNFGTHDDAADWLTRPFGPWLGRLMLGSHRSWEPHNELQGKYWSTNYPTATLVEVVRLLDYVQARLPLALDAGLLVLLSPNDSVVSPAKTRLALQQITAARKQVLEIDRVGDPSDHILGGDILSPGSTDWVVDVTLKFINGE